MSRRLLASYLGLAFALLVVLMVPLGLTHARAERDDILSRMEHDAATLATIAESALDGGADPGLIRRQVAAYQRDFGGRAVVVDATGRAIADSAGEGSPDTFSSRPEIAQALRGRVARGERRSAALDREILYVATPVAPGGEVRGAVRVTYAATALHENIRRYWLALAGIAGVVVAGATGLGLVIAGWISRPLDRVRLAATAAGRDLSARAPTDIGPPEVRELGAAINDTIGKLDALVRSREAFVADASHQLRTPLAALTLRLESLEDEVGPEGRADLDAALAEVARLARLVDGLLALSRADESVAHPVEVDVGAVVGGRVDAWSALAAEQSVRIRSDVRTRASAVATPGHLEQVLDNLIANAVAASPADSTVDVRVEDADRRVVIHVVDRGPGFSEDERGRAFDRFWRGARDGQGSGLGLAIVRRLVAADGGDVELAANPAGGVDAIVRLRAQPGAGAGAKQ